MKKRNIVGTLAVFMFLLIGIQTVTAAPSAKEYLKAGNDALRDGNYNHAVSMYEEILSLYPNSKEAQEAKKKLEDKRLRDIYAKNQAEVQRRQKEQAEEEAWAKAAAEAEARKAAARQPREIAESPESDFIVTLDKAGTGVVITGYKGSGGDVRFPAQIQGMPVKEITAGIFKGVRNHITSITIPGGVTKIADEAFSFDPGMYFNGRPQNQIGLYGLIWVRILDGVKSIGKNAFATCINLESVIIPDSVDSIDFGVFQNCEKLTSVTLPKSLKEIQGFLFNDCTSLKTITIPASVTSIGQNAFYKTPLKEITIPTSVTSIGAQAFNVTLLKEITIPASVTSIGAGAFANCTMTSVTFLTTKDIQIGAQAFAFLKSLATIEIPQGVTTLARRTFQECTSLTSVSLPSTIKTISSEAFVGCSNLTSVTIPDSVGTIAFPDQNAFKGCSNLNLATQAALKKRGYTGSF